MQAALQTVRDFMGFSFAHGRRIQNVDSRNMALFIKAVPAYWIYK